MRIYDLAKSIEQRLDIKVKSSQLAEEFRTLPEFAEIHSTIRSHSSSVDDRFAKLMFSIYQQRHPSAGGNPRSPQRTAAPAKEQPPVRVVAAAPPVKAAPRPASVVPMAPRLNAVPVRPTPIPRMAPIAPGPLSHQAPIPTVPRPTPIQTHARVAPAAEPTPDISPAAPKGPVMRPVAPKPQQRVFRPSAPATELKSSTGTTGISATPEGRASSGGGADAPGETMRATGQPQAPPPPKFSSQSPFVRPTPMRPSLKAKPAGGLKAPGGRAGADGGKEQPLVFTEEVPLLEIGQMKTRGKRHREKRGPEEGEERPKAPRVSSKKTVRPSKVYGDADEFRRPLKVVKSKRGGLERRREEVKPEAKGPVVITGPLTVAEFADKIEQPAAEVIKRAFLKGHTITINRLIDFDLAEELALELEVDLIVRLEEDETDIEEFRGRADLEEDLAPRSPVVTIMGHVDHGKTTILDYYRRSQVVEGEYGGITQHIGAYKVPTRQGEIVFLDTPGHEAFTAMRARGVKATDLVVLVVAADDGVMPQTIEAINHTKAAEVPMIVAINKMDLPGADPTRVRNALMQYGVLATQLGGDVEFVEIAAKTGQGMEDLLEVIGLQSQVLELRANPNRPAEAVVIESHVDPLRGAVATVLVRNGTLRIGDFFVVGKQNGRVRLMLDDHGRTLTVAPPGTPLGLFGLTGTPEVGEMLLMMEDERKAREIAERRSARRRLVQLGTTRHVTLEGLHNLISEGEIKSLNIILKTDVQGSIEAISQSLEKLSGSEIRIRILHSGTGSITESDVQLANASSAIIIGFNVRPDPTAAELAQREGIDIKLYRLIYELLEEVEKALVGMLEKRYEEKTTGRVQVRKIFRVSRVGMIAGCYVLEGEIGRGAKCRLVRDGTVVYAGRIGSLRRVKDDVAKVNAGFECGIMLESFQDVKEGDIIEPYILEEIPAELSRSHS